MMAGRFPLQIDVLQITVSATHLQQYLQRYNVFIISVIKRNCCRWQIILKKIIYV